MRGELIVAGVIVAAIPVSTFASYPEGTVKRYLCKLEIRIGPYGNGDGNKLPVTYSGQAQAGQVFTGQEGQYMCYRRENMPGDCSSAVGPNFNCIQGWNGIEVGQPASLEIQ
ncbi:hypothetical protein D9X30_4638 (plasmid) [Cupriavidus sp. U2]|uniref:hypothetical protein n=1 Tax=Cupriavidus sp. U2 TaxID=2920269 RepID=UPI00129DB26A|nr:hypothetical protein [Cupriavidus sp. U2]KAI3590405.1 hypothetical protein D9X30_4638 [Cupriavidus sp. U2]